MCCLAPSYLQTNKRAGKHRQGKQSKGSKGEQGKARASKGKQGRARESKGKQGKAKQERNTASNTIRTNIIFKIRRTSTTSCFQLTLHSSIPCQLRLGASDLPMGYFSETPAEATIDCGRRNKQHIPPTCRVGRANEQGCSFGGFPLKSANPPNTTGHMQISWSLQDPKWVGRRKCPEPSACH